MGLDSVKEMDRESKADKNQIKDSRLKTEERQNPHILFWRFIALFSFSTYFILLSQCIWCITGTQRAYPKSIDDEEKIIGT